jgi:outer membrane receptor protein involved in Fe transport
VFGSGDDLNRNTVQRVFGSYDRYDAVSLKLARDLAPGVTASVAVDNLLDAEYFQFYRQPGRSVYFEVAVRR